VNPTPITRGREALTRRSFAAPSLPIVAKVGGGAPAQAIGRSQRELVQWVADVVAGAPGPPDDTLIQRISLTLRC
jgi:hypothetical protein